MLAFQEGLAGGAQIALSYALLGAFAMAVASSGLPNLLANWLIGKLGVDSTRAKTRTIMWTKWGMVAGILAMAVMSQNLIPVHIAFIPLIIVMLGLGFQAKVLVVFLGAVMPVILNAYAGVRAADPDLVEMARASGATRPQIFRRILLPGALPFIVVGLRLGATIGLINTVVAELYTAVRGLGGLLAIIGNTFQLAPYFVVVFVLAAIGTLVTTGLRLIEVSTERWPYDGNG